MARTKREGTRLPKEYQSDFDNRASEKGFEVDHEKYKYIEVTKDWGDNKVAFAARGRADITFYERNGYEVVPDSSDVCADPSLVLMRIPMWKWQKARDEEERRANHGINSKDHVETFINSRNYEGLKGGMLVQDSKPITLEEAFKASPNAGDVDAEKAKNAQLLAENPKVYDAIHGG